MTQVRVALVCPDDRLRMLAAQAFDDAPPEWEVSLHREPPDGGSVLVAVGCELPGAVAFDLAQPARVVDEVKRLLTTKQHRLITVVGASGGCGTTTVAIHLAATSSSSVCLISSRPAQVADRLGLDPVTVGGEPIPVPGGFKIAAFSADELPGAVERFAERFEAVIVDADPTGLPPAAERGVACVLVALPTIPSAKAGARVLEAFPRFRWAIVTNRLGPGGETGSAELQRILGRRICLQLPCSRAVRDAEDGSRLVAPWSPWRRKVARLARALELP